MGSARCVNQLLFDRVDLDLAEKLREQVLVASVVKKRQGSVSLLEVGKFSGVGGNGRSLVVALSVVGELNRPANKDQVGVLGGDLELELLVEHGVETVLADDLCLVLEGRVMLHGQVGVGLLLIALVVGVEDLNFHVGVHGLVRGEVGGSHKLLGRDDVDAERDNATFLLALGNVGVVGENLDVSEFGGLENVAGGVLATVEHGTVELHSKVKSLPVKGGHLNTASPVDEGIKVVRGNASAVRVDSHHVAHVVDVEGHFLVLGTRVLGKARLHEREDVIVLLGVDSVKARELYSGAVDSKITKNLDGLVGGLLDWLFTCALVVAGAAAQTILDSTLGDGVNSSLADQSSGRVAWGEHRALGKRLRRHQRSTVWDGGAHHRRVKAVASASTTEVIARGNRLLLDLRLLDLDKNTLHKFRGGRKLVGESLQSLSNQS